MSLRMQALEMILGRSGASEKVAAHFLDRHAESAETAIPFTPSGDRQREQFGLLSSGRVIVASGKRYYIDRGAYDAVRARQRRVQGAVVVAVAALVVVGLFAFVGA